ncbi:uncharacterized protein LOC134196419 [Corticium candelabrum]|uniref:uncharacterized protein LOC134196419 n=1 Tax=Corticium candelabrum TaxID=121492 RepID=UPI002E25ED4C|nr:uncharacterized protein LOC134196419 [Corticium candelabrum]
MHSQLQKAHTKLKGKESELELEKRRRWAIEAELKAEKQMCTDLREKNRKMYDGHVERERKLGQSHDLAIAALRTQLLLLKGKVSELESKQRRMWEVEAELECEKNVTAELREEIRRLNDDQLDRQKRFHQLCDILTKGRTDDVRQQTERELMCLSHHHVHTRSHSEKHRTRTSHSRDGECDIPQTCSVDRRAVGRKAPEVRCTTRIPLSDLLWEERLRPQYAYVVDVLKPDKLLPTLFADGVIDCDEFSTLRKARETLTDKGVSEKLLMDILYKKPPGSFDKFCSALRKVSGGQQHIADVLSEGFDYHVISSAS